ncbi:hypothetical protein ACTNC4_07115 [Collinsella sp. HCP3S3_B8]|uniref:hypothetical protein n=1 Tax=Collinsella sp. HCP3S3_B8 TaxID=3438933 RepID=UPI003F8A8443
MSVELPRDAEGREIPLDTVVLFSRSGEAHNIVRWIYTTDFETWTESNMWRAIAENHRALDPELMYLTPPDSWEKLEDDLGKIANNPGEVVCAYFGREISDCDGCKLESCECACSNAYLRDVIERIRKLRGEDE